MHVHDSETHTTHIGTQPCEPHCAATARDSIQYLKRSVQRVVLCVRRRTGKIKGIERFLGAVDVLQESLIEVTSGQAKYEHQHRAIVWRMPRLPKEGQGTYLH